MAYAESWHVRSRSRECAITQVPFTDGETIVTALYPDPESSGYMRKDIRLDAWKSMPDDAEKPFSFWKSVFTAPSTGQTQDQVQKLSPEEILHRLVEEDEDHTENTRYILAVMLERRKILRETDSQPTPNGILRVYEHRKSGEIFLIRDPNIPLSQVEDLQKEVFELLENNGRLPTPVTAESAQESPPVSETQETESSLTDSESAPNPPDAEPDPSQEQPPEEIGHPREAE